VLGHDASRQEASQPLESPHSIYESAIEKTGLWDDLARALFFGVLFYVPAVKTSLPL